MRAIILAAGRGERLRPLTDHTPKPLLDVRGKPLIVWHIEALAAAGVRDIVINCAWLGEQFPARLGDGSAFGLRLHYSMEPVGALETAGGIAQALPLLGADGQDAFWVVSGDVFLPGFPFDPAAAARFAAGDALAHLWMVDNAPHHPRGDFAIDAQGLARLDGAPRYTWASVGLFRAAFFAAVKPGERAALRPHLDAAIAAGRMSAEHYAGAWTDVGTAERLAALNKPA
ncbi:nucleotidyltransferase family protein [Roseateles sp. DAIF2]|uniref:N-acetylmuramate alpha-1-phosphate uridylyltransferase MurU n=1 Tax=Roseateles sp. DAIF2 TaxID=2714952 RepID=UPI0018A30CAF|nr:nucleotidyltransferase family protein [Roseateles sp. DAIF2]QPF75932.1 nucleotidyltransferase family protein [Roseateles sp. DAIF2]